MSEEVIFEFDNNDGYEIEEFEDVSYETYGEEALVESSIFAPGYAPNRNFQRGNSSGLLARRFPNFFPDYPPPCIVFDGYYVRFFRTRLNGVPLLVWYLIPESNQRTQIYRYYFKKQIAKYIYEPVDPNNVAIPIVATANDQTQVTYILQPIPGSNCEGLVPYLAYGPVPSPPTPLTIIGYQYLPITIIEGGVSSTRYSFVPVNCPNPCTKTCPPRNPCVIPCLTPCITPCPPVVPYVRDVTYYFNPISATVGETTYLYAVASVPTLPTTVTTLPYILESNNGTNISAEILPITIGTMTGVGLNLPNYQSSYKVNFTVQLRVNTASDANGVPFINYLTPGPGATGPPVVASIPALASAVVVEQNATGQITVNSPQLTITWNQMIVKTTGLPQIPVNFTTYGTTPAQFYTNVIPQISLTGTFVVPPPPINPVTGLPYALNSRILSLQVSDAFSFFSGRIHVTNV